MNQTLQKLMQANMDPCDLADSVAAYIQSRSEKMNPTIEKIGRVIEGEITAEQFINDNSVYHWWSYYFDPDNTEATFLDLDELVQSIENGIDSDEGPVDVTIYNSNLEPSAPISVAQVLDALNNTSSQTEMLVTSLTIAQQVADGDTTDFLVTSFAKIDGYLAGTDASSRLKGIFTTIYEELRENAFEATDLVQSILIHFGIIGNSNDSRRNDASEYTGQSALNVLAMDAIDRIGWTVQNIPVALQGIVALIAVIANCVVDLVSHMFKGIMKLGEKAVIKAFQLDDAVQKCTIPGRGYVKTPGFSVIFDGLHTHYPTGEQFAHVYDLLELNMSNPDVESQYTIPCGPVVIYLNWLITKAELSYIIRPIDFNTYRQVFKDHFGNYPYFSIKNNAGVIEADSTGMSLEGLARWELIEFIEDLYSRDHIWTMDYAYDSQRYMCIQASRHLCSLIYALSDSTWSNIDFSLASECRDMIYIDVTDEYGYVQSTHQFVPENINFASLCTEIGQSSHRVDCFYGFNNDNNALDFTNNDIEASIRGVSCRFMTALGSIAANAIGIDPTETSGYFVPYFHKFKHYRPSYFIPTDTENVSYAKRLIVTGFIAVATIVAVVMTVKLMNKFKRRKWIMEQQAAQKAFTASETGNAALLQEGWKLQKRVNLLGTLCGATTIAATPITNGVTTMTQAIVTGGPTSSSDQYTLRSLFRSITGR